MRQFHQQYQEWSRLPLPPRGWPPVPQTDLSNGGDPSSVICLWDGATRCGLHSAGGIVLLTPSGQVLLETGVQFEDIDESMLVELIAHREVILWCLANGFVEVRFHGNAKVIIEKIQQAYTRDSRLGIILEDVCRLLVAHSGFSVRYVGRRNNREAHLVARKAISLYSTSCSSFAFLSWLNSRV
ncbi:unnamed protein product [Linum trigynum]|uniref:RNase H type-1 domain-containing protein n=1 Tax=Linum trigynum TaxID=586398 RepID=A0AAV2CCU7_9ROSI